MMGGPGVARIITEYGDKFVAMHCHDDRHHEQLPSIQREFMKDVQSVVITMNDLGNPFDDDTQDLFALDTKVIMPKEVINCYTSAANLGNDQYSGFVNGRLTKDTSTFYDTVSRNNLNLFKSGSSSTSSKTKSKLTGMKSDRQLFSRLYVSCQARGGDLNVFFQHENQPWPPALADNDCMHHGKKSDLVDCLEKLAPVQQETPQVSVRVFDGAALVHALDPNKLQPQLKTFEEYAKEIFIPHIAKELSSNQRVADSLKSDTRKSRVRANTRLPLSWGSFLRVDSNKEDLYKYLALQIESTPIPAGKTLITTHGTDVFCTSTTEDVSDLQPCTHEEADYRLMLHVAHAYKAGFTDIAVHANDTDVLVLCVATASGLHGARLWLVFGPDKRYISPHTIAEKEVCYFFMQSVDAILFPPQ